MVRPILEREIAAVTNTAPLKARAQKSIPEFGGAENLRQETKEKLHPSLASNKQSNEAAEGRRGGEKRVVRKRLAQRFC